SNPINEIIGEMCLSDSKKLYFDRSILSLLSLLLIFLYCLECTLALPLDPLPRGAQHLVIGALAVHNHFVRRVSNDTDGHAFAGGVEGQCAEHLQCRLLIVGSNERDGIAGSCGQMVPESPRSSYERQLIRTLALVVNIHVSLQPLLLFLQVRFRE
ncbi:hypothetical protein PFISCL1PPCAC_13285, partial [Pristionchus fissidentatus]